MSYHSTPYALSNHCQHNQWANAYNEIDKDILHSHFCQSNICKYKMHLTCAFGKRESLRYHLNHMTMPRFSRISNWFACYNIQNSWTVHWTQYSTVFPSNAYLTWICLSFKLKCRSPAKNFYKILQFLPYKLFGKKKKTLMTRLPISICKNCNNH